MTEVKLDIKGLQEAQQRNQARIAAMQPSGAFGEAVRWATTEAQRYAIAITHVDTGALRASHMMRVDALEGRVYIDPTARNPRTQQLTSEYGVYEHERGGTHAFYKRTVEERGPYIARRAMAMLAEAM